MVYVLDRYATITTAFEFALDEKEIDRKLLVATISTPGTYPLRPDGSVTMRGWREVLIDQRTSAHSLTI